LPESSVVQGIEYTASAPTIITTIADVAGFTFPGVQGHMRARTAASITGSASFSSGSVLFDAATGLPPIVPAGCPLAGTAFSSACRNVFTNINSTPTNGTTTFAGAPASRVTMLNDGNADAVGALIAPTATVTGILSSHWQTIVRRVVAGHGGGSTAKLGGVDRSTVAVIGRALSRARRDRR
jgi:hypothetical protein